MVTCALFFLLGLTLTTDVSNYYVVIIITPHIYITVHSKFPNKVKYLRRNFEFCKVKGKKYSLIFLEVPKNVILIFIHVVTVLILKILCLHSCAKIQNDWKRDYLQWMTIPCVKKDMQCFVMEAFSDFYFRFWYFIIIFFFVNSGRYIHVRNHGYLLWRMEYSVHRHLRMHFYWLGLW